MNDPADFSRCELVEFHGHKGEIFHIRFGDFLVIVVEWNGSKREKIAANEDFSMRKSTAPAPDRKRLLHGSKVTVHETRQDSQWSGQAPGP